MTTGPVTHTPRLTHLQLGLTQDSLQPANEILPRLFLQAHATGTAVVRQHLADVHAGAVEEKGSLVSHFRLR